ncbi:MAG: universal stress protein [Cytophagales bacterium]|nr:universal stress protein [Armatimonadota bacterium]
MYRKIIVCIDDTPLSEKVALAGADLARRYSAEVVLLSVLDPARFARQPYSGLEAVQMLDRNSRSLSNRAHRLSALLDSMGVRSQQVLVPGRSVETILNVAETESADLIVIGTEARGRLHAWLDNDLWSQVSHKAPCNVLRVTPLGRIEEDRNSDTPARPSGLRGLLSAPMSAL